MSDRALKLCIGLSLAIHLIVSLGLSGARFTTTSVRPPPAAPPVRLRLAGASSEPERADARRPEVSAAPPRTEPTRNPAPKTKPELQPENAESVLQESVRPEPAVEATATPAPLPATSNALAALEVQAESNPERFEAGASSSTAPAGSAGAGSVDEQAADLLARYVEAIRARVRDRKRYPPLARKRAVEGRVVARIAIRADGRLDAVEFDDDAPPLLRRATDEAIRSAGPYAAPPAGAITIELPVDYSLRDAS
ncbi:MAG: energy transducer TonB [Deltaproteobacteria bacterium]|nr:energy transducer TonB [Deltaproteobacteria bacterium]